jgi:hypothetical protein
MGKRGPALIRQADINKVLRAFGAAGTKAKVEMTPGKVTISPIDDNTPAENGKRNEWDEELNNGKDQTEVR